MTMQKKLSRFIGDKAFYRTLMTIVIPVILQNGITNLVSLLDNIMVGAVGTEQMSGVSIVNQLMFVFNLCIFGGLSGAGIFTAQFYGKGDTEGVRHTFRFKMMLCAGIIVAGVVVFLAAGESLVGMYLHEGGETGDIAATAMYGKDYMMVMLWGLLPFALTQAYASTLRETGETMLPMKAGVVAILVNLVLNWVLIFGNLGAPKMGVAGAALATVISRYVETFIVMAWTHRHTERNPFIVKAYRSMHVPAQLVKQICRKGMPLLMNEMLWSCGIAMLTQSYSTRGLAVVAGLNICTTITNLFNVVWLSMGTAVSIIVGQQLGANEFKKAEESMWRIMAFSVLSALAMAVMLFLVAPLFPMMYNTSQEVRDIATGLLRVVAFSGPLHACCHTSYFTLRSGGKTGITFVFDSVYLWVVSIPLARILATGTAWPILIVYGAVQYIDILKCILGCYLLKKGVWINNIVND